MVGAPAARHRAQSLGEEIANSISHGTGFLAALIALPVLVIGAARHGAAAIVGAGVFAATMALLYLTSTLYHALAPNRAKRVLPDSRPRCDIPPHRRDLHAFHTGRSLGTLGLDALRAHLGPRRGRNCTQIGRGSSIPPDFDWVLRGHGMVDSGRGKAVVARDVRVGPLLARGRRCHVHGGSWILCRQADAVRPFCVAPVRTRGHGVSLHCRAAVRGLTGAFALRPRASHPRGVVPHPRPARAGRVTLHPYQQTGF